LIEEIHVAEASSFFLLETVSIGVRIYNGTVVKEEKLTVSPTGIVSKECGITSTETATPDNSEEICEEGREIKIELKIALNRCINLTDESRVDSCSE
jgi:hypothetical protein